MMKPSVLSSVFVAALLGFAGMSWGKEDEGLYKIESKPIALKQGVKAQASFAIVLKEGAKIHPKAPFLCAVSASKGVEIDKAKLGHADTKASQDNRHVEVPVGVKANEKGAQAVSMDCSFYVCTKDICVRKEEAVKISAKVE